MNKKGYGKRSKKIKEKMQERVGGRTSPHYIAPVEGLGIWTINEGKLC